MRAFAQTILAFLLLTTGAFAQTLVVNEGANLNIRTGPGTSFPVMARLEGGETLEQRGRSGDWLLTTQGWVHSDFVARLHNVVPARAPDVTIGLAGGQLGAVTQAALSPDGRLLATRARDPGLVQFWDFETGAFLGDHIHSADFSDEDEPFVRIGFLSGERLAVYSLNDHMIVLDVPSLTEIYRGEAFRGAVVKADEAFFITEHHGEVFYYDAADLQVIESKNLATPSREELAIALHENRIDMAEYNLRTILVDAYRPDILAHDFADGKHRMYLGTSTEGVGEISVLDMDRTVLDVRPTGPETYLRVFPQTQTAYGYSDLDADGARRIFDLRTGEIIEDWSDITSNLYFGSSDLDQLWYDHNYGVTPDGRYYMMIDEARYGPENARIELRDIVTRKILTLELPATFERTSSSHFPDGSHLILSGQSSSQYSERDAAVSSELWKIDIEALFALDVSSIHLSAEHAAVTPFRTGEVDYQPVQYVAANIDRSFLLASGDRQMLWFDPATMAATSTLGGNFRGGLMVYRSADGAAHYVSGTGAFVHSGFGGTPLAVSVVQGAAAPDYMFNELAFESRVGPGPEIMPARLATNRWNAPFEVRTPLGDSGWSTRNYQVGGPEILQSTDGRTFALSLAANDMSIVRVADVITSSESVWPAWEPVSGVRAITRTSGVFSGAWNRSVDGRSFLAANELGRPGTYFLDDRTFIPFDKAAFIWLSENAVGESDLLHEMSRRLGFIYMHDGNLLVMPPEDRCSPPLLIAPSTGESRILATENPRIFCLPWDVRSDSLHKPQALDGRKLIVDNAVYDIETGHHLFALPAGRNYAASADGRHIYVTRQSGIVTILDSAAGGAIADLYVMTDGSWVVMTPEGFYASGNGGDSHLRVAQGLLSTFSIDKFRDALYRPDLVAEAFRGDPEQLLHRAAQAIDLERILLSGAAPLIATTGSQDGAIYSATADITDQGGGIGRLEWRVNGVVQHSAEGLEAFSADLYLAEGENRIELVAYNSDNTIQGRSAATTLSAQIEELGQPRLYILALGVDDYALDALALRYAANDTTVMAREFARAGEGLYSEIFTNLLIDHEVTRENLDAVFRSLAGTVRPNDVFVFFSAGHGKTLDGRYFFIPQDFTGTTVASIRDEGIGHAQWQEWFSMIPAQKSLLLFDTCESGSLAESLVGRDLRFRSATDLLGNATGRALIAASSSTELAWEGYEGHGVFTYSVLQALQTADLNGDGLIDIDEMAAVIQDTVPTIAAQVWNERQTPQFKAPEVSFPVALPLLTEVL